MITVVKVAVDRSNYSFDKLFDYEVPEELLSKALPGCRVNIPFGKYNAKKEGFIFERYSVENKSNLKTISAVLDEAPLFDDDMISLVLWMKERYFCNLYEIVKLMLPPGIKKVKDAKKKLIRVSNKSKVKLSDKQQNVYNFVLDKESSSIKEICYHTGVTSSVVNTLIKKGILESFESNVYRNPFLKAEISVVKNNIILTDEQQKAYISLKEKYKINNGEISLLYGITGSGKTSVFMKLIDEVIKDEKSVIIMVPEIALTSQMILIFKSRFGDDVAVFHSGLSSGERYDEWKRVKNKKAKIVIGTRSAIFAPCNNLGLIIIDEEQEYTYKSESSPRFHARDVAKFRAKKTGALLLLSSATPSIETFFYAKNNLYSMNKLAKRYGNSKLPKVKIIDMNEECKEGNTSQFSGYLIDNIRENIKSNKQSIILLNRRGYHTFASCRSCGEVVTCPHCSISLIYHRANNKLMCHYCGYSMNFIDECPSCKKKDIRYSGFGTQKVEEELTLLIPSVRILRMDADTTMTKFSHEKSFDKFKKGEYDVMIGTQMVAKGLNFPDVTLVGVLSADQSLYSDDFRSYERAFSLFTQVVGRSGRSDSEGKAVIQTYTPENPIIQLAANQDYEKFYENEIKLRKMMLYPPYSDICVIGFTGEDEEKTKESSKDFMSDLIKNAKSKYTNLPLRILGPSSASVYKVNNKFRYKIIIKCRNNRLFREMISKNLLVFKGKKCYNSIRVFVDTNPDIIL